MLYPTTMCPLCAQSHKPEMTIDSGWVRVFKEQVAPQAFTPTCPFRAKVAYIDGMPLLMISEGRISQWGEFLRSNFARTIGRYFRMGCEAVVLAFDDYDHVPKAKAITQARRTPCVVCQYNHRHKNSHAQRCSQANRAKVAKSTYDFAEGQQLPSTIPDGYNQKLTNRTFKRRVIDMICNCIMEHCASPMAPDKTLDRKLVIDYSGCPIQFTCPAGSAAFEKQPVYLSELPPLGEADVKYLRWAQHFQARHPYDKMIQPSDDRMIQSMTE